MCACEFVCVRNAHTCAYAEWLVSTVDGARVLGGEREQYIDAARRRRRAHRIGQPAAAAAARQQLGAGHADGSDTHLPCIDAYAYTCTHCA